MLNAGAHAFECYAHILNADRTILKLNPALRKLGYQFIWVDATEFERNFSEILNIPKSSSRPLTIIIGREQHGISHELHNALIHSPSFGQMFMHMEYPGLLLLNRLKGFNTNNDFDDIVLEQKEFFAFYTFINNLLLQLRLFKIGEIRCSQFFSITSDSRQIGLRKVEISIGSWGDFTLTEEEATQLSEKIVAQYETTPFTDLAIQNFSIVYDLPDGLIRFITLMTCLESLFNLGKDQIAHTIARHLSLIISHTPEQFREHYGKIKRLYNLRNSIVHGGTYKGEIVEDYLELSDYVRRAINYCNVPDLTKEVLFSRLNAKGFQ